MLRLGDKGERVKCLERALRLTPGGTFDDLLNREVKAFQAAHGLDADGIVGTKTWAALRGFPVVERHAALTCWGARARAIEGIVIHHSCTATAARTAAVLESRGLSTNFEVDRDGQVIEYGDPTVKVAWHCGGGVNGRSIGIDATHMSGKPWPQAQAAAVSALLAWLCKIYGLPFVTAPDQSLGKGALSPAWGVYRHRNLAATACPEDLPLP